MGNRHDLPQVSEGRNDFCIRRIDVMKRLFAPLLICSVLVCACQQVPNSIRASQTYQPSQLEEARDNEVMRLNTLPETQGNFSRFARQGGTLIIDEPGYDYLETKDRLICSLNQVEFQQSVFDKVRVTRGKTDPMGVPTDANMQLVITLPIASGLPAGCELMPGTHGMR